MSLYRFLWSLYRCLKLEWAHTELWQNVIMLKLTGEPSDSFFFFSLCSDAVTHVVSEESQASSLWKWLKESAPKNLPNMHVLDISWFTDSMKEGRPVAVETRHLIPVCACHTSARNSEIALGTKQEVFHWVCYHKMICEETHSHLLFNAYCEWISTMSRYVVSFFLSLQIYNVSPWQGALTKRTYLTCICLISYYYTSPRWKQQKHPPYCVGVPNKPISWTSGLRAVH